MWPAKSQMPKCTWVMAARKRRFKQSRWLQSRSMSPYVFARLTTIKPRSSEQQNTTNRFAFEHSWEVQMFFVATPTLHHQVWKICATQILSVKHLPSNPYFFSASLPWLKAYSRRPGASREAGNFNKLALTYVCYADTCNVHIHWYIFFVNLHLYCLYLHTSTIIYRNRIYVCRIFMRYTGGVSTSVSPQSHGCRSNDDRNNWSQKR